MQPNAMKSQQTLYPGRRVIGLSNIVSSYYVLDPFS